MEIKYCPICMQEMAVVKKGWLRVFQCPYCKIIFHISWEIK